MCTFCGYECPCTYSERDHETDTCTLCGRSIPAEAIWGPSPDALTSRGTWREMYMDNKNTGVVYAKLINNIRFDENYDSGDAAAMNYSLPPESLYLDLNGHMFETSMLVVDEEITIDDSAGGGKMSSLFAAGSDLDFDQSLNLFGGTVFRQDRFVTDDLAVGYQFIYCQSHTVDVAAEADG